MKLHDLIEEFMNKKMINEGIVRDFLDGIAKGKYKYLIGKDRSNKPIIKDIETGEFASFDAIKSFLGK